MSWCSRLGNRSHIAMHTMCHTGGSCLRWWQTRGVAVVGVGAPLWMGSAGVRVVACGGTGEVARLGTHGSRYPATRKWAN
jgi:hypothetical protein